MRKVKVTGEKKAVFLFNSDDKGPDQLKGCLESETAGGDNCRRDLPCSRNRDLLAYCTRIVLTGRTNAYSRDGEKLGEGGLGKGTWWRIAPSNETST